MIPFNKPYVIGSELDYIKQAVATGKISGDGLFSGKCHAFFEKRYGFRKVLLTTSCTDALEMAAILLGIAPGDEVIAPAYTFVSTVNAFVLRGARIVFADSEKLTPNIDATQIESLITPRTKAIVVVHYAGAACDMQTIMELSERYRIPVVEDAAQAIDSYHRSRPLGGIGQFGTFSFHETKNIIAGEGGLLCVNDPAFVSRAEIIREKGTNRSAFFRGEVDKYGWVDIGSSFLPSDIMAAYLYGQLQHLEEIQSRRKSIWELYRQHLEPVALEGGRFATPYFHDYATNNGHMFYLVCDSLSSRSGLIEYLKGSGIMAVFHYLSLHKSPFYAGKHDGRNLPNSDRYADCLVRLPLFYEMTDDEVFQVIEAVTEYFKPDTGKR